MAKGNPRLDRAVKEAVAEIVETEVADPRLSLVTITDAHVTPDQKYATIYYSVMAADVVSRDPARTGGDHLPGEAEVADGFAAARARIQGLVGRRLHTRNTPELRFEPDPVASQAARVEDLLRRVRGDGS